MIGGPPVVEPDPPEMIIVGVVMIGIVVVGGIVGMVDGETQELPLWTYPVLQIQLNPL